MRALLLLDDTRFDLHKPPENHPERPERLAACRRALTNLQGTPSATIRSVSAREATNDELLRVHSERLVASLEALRGKSATLDADTYVSAHSVEAARLASGGAIDLIEELLLPRAAESKALALVRPPGHHATRDRAMGFCLFNHVAAACAHAKTRGVRRTLVVDWDVHHGNGTQDIFWTDPEVLYLSLHQFPHYPGTGAVTEVGEGAGRGYTINVPLHSSAGDSVYRSAFEQIVIPVADAYKPELVVVSAGFDASNRDPLAHMQLTQEGFGWMAEALRKVADRHAGGRMLMALEGGYDLTALEEGLRGAIEGMLGRPFEIRPRSLPPFAREHDGDLRRAASSAAQFWPGIHHP